MQQKRWPLDSRARAGTSLLADDTRHQMLEDRGNATLMSSSGPYPIDEYVWLGGRPVAVVRGQFSPSWVRQADDSPVCKRNGEAGLCGLYGLTTDVLGKPGTVECCREQLRASSGREVVFLTAVHLIDGPVGTAESHMDRTVVRFRALSDAEIDRYIERDQPLDCAGGFKAESLGIALFDSIASNDPTGLTGLPLAWVGAALRRAGFAVP